MSNQQEEVNRKSGRSIAGYGTIVSLKHTSDYEFQVFLTLCGMID
jgi:hypothetical protein